MEVQLGAAASSLFLLLAIGTIVYRGLEDWTWIQSFYFSVAILATIGYGTCTPHPTPLACSPPSIFLEELP
jgi:hypothetical protein